MSHREFFLERFRAERPAFVNVLRALPNDKLDYKPHERSSSAADIAWFLVLELRGLAELVNTKAMHWKQAPNPKSAAAIVSGYEEAWRDLEKAIESGGARRWEEEGSMYAGERLIKKGPIGDTVWDFFFDAIHHRGQLTTYIRPMGGKVPSTYGPTADSR